MGDKAKLLLLGPFVEVYREMVSGLIGIVDWFVSSTTRHSRAVGRAMEGTFASCVPTMIPHV